MGITDEPDEFLVKLKAKANLPLDLKCRRDKTHQYEYMGKKLSLRAVRYLKEHFRANYDCIRDLVDMGLVRRSYYADILSKKNYSY